MVKPYVFQIVGYQNSGKTTFVNKLLTELHLAGYKTATIKHHGHGGKPAIVENKDSFHHITAGAEASLVEGDGRIVLQVENTDLTLENKIDILKMFKPDIILIEGHKYENYPKLVFIRNEGDYPLLDELKNIKVILLNDYRMKEYTSPSFFRDDPNSIKWVMEYIESQVNI